MADNTAIEWTDATWNPVTGCSVVSPGCTNCYAMRLSGTRLRNHPSRAGLTAPSKAGPVWTSEVRLNEQWLDMPLRWRKPRRIFVCAHGDLFHEKVPDKWIDRVFAVMALAPQHTFQVLTKRAGRMREYLSHVNRRDAIALEATDLIVSFTSLPISAADRIMLPLPNVWLLVSCEDQERAEHRIPDLLETPAAIRGLSLEPLLDHIDVRPFFYSTGAPFAGYTVGYTTQLGLLDWVIVGGESGPSARPCRIEWVRDIVDECKAAGVACFVKQLGRKPYTAGLELGRWPTPAWKGSGDWHRRVLKDQKGGDWKEWPDDLRVRQLPVHREPSI